MKILYAIDLGRKDYSEILKIQRRIEEQVQENKKLAYLLVTENNPVITMGKSSEEGEVYCNDMLLSVMGIKKHKVDRGGRVTIHSPGQIVCYPILNLENYRKDLHWYVKKIEDVVGHTLDEFGIENTISRGKTGIWTCDGKICGIGIKVKRWVTTHGFALNHMNNLKLFEFINPCGLKDYGISKIEYYNKRLKRRKIVEKIYKNFEKEFECKVIELSIDKIK